MPALSKITAPTFSNIVLHERLFRLLDDSIRRPITWIAGPGGSGKTSLAGSYLKSRGIPCVWYKVDGGDADIATFFYYMGLAARKAAPGKRKPLPLLTPEHLPDIHFFTLRYFETLFQRLKPPFAFVFDDYHEVSGESHFHEMMSAGLSALPEGIVSLVISRRPAPQHFSRQRANNRMSTVGWHDLRLTENETRRIADQRLDRPLDDKALSLLHARTEGWAAGIVLLLDHAKAQSPGFKIIGELEPSAVFHYFAYETFGKKDPGMRNFLLQTSFLPFMTPAMAEAITGTKGAGKILQWLHEQNYFTERRIGKEPIYLYHSLFREFLNAQAGKLHAGSEISALRRRAAETLLDAGHAEDAAALLIEAADWEPLSAPLLKYAPVLMSQGRSRTLEELIAAIPEKKIAENPWILYWKGVCTLSASPAESRSCFERAFGKFEETGDDAGIFMSWAGAVETFLFELADFRPMDKWIEWLDARMTISPSFPSAEIEARVAACMTGALIWRMPAHPGIKKWLNTALALAHRLPNADARIRAFLDISLYHLWMGENSEGALIIDQIRKMAATGATSPIMAISAKHAEALFLNSDVAQAEKAMQLVDEGLALAGMSGVHVMDVHLLGHGVQGAINAGNVSMMQKHLADMEGLLPGGRGISESLYSYLSARLNLVLDNPRKAAVFAEKSVQLIVQVGAPLPEAMNRMVLVIALCGVGDHGKAAGELDRIRSLNEKIGSQYIDYLYQLIRAHAEFARNNDGKGLAALQRALNAVRRNSDLAATTTFLRPRDMARLCEKALESGLEAETVRSLVMKLRLSPDDAALAPECWPWPVKISTLGCFAVVTIGDSIAERRKLQKMPLLLLKAIIALGGREIREQSLVDVLWSEAEGDAGHNAFTTTLARLRRMLGNKRSVLLQDGLVTLDSRLCWVDSLAFEMLCHRAEELFGKDAPAFKKIAANALKLYGGPFLLTDAHALWTVAPRDRLRAYYLRLILKNGLLCMQTGSPVEAAACYQKGLEFEPLAEELYQGLMASLISLGRFSDSLIAYRRCRDILQAQLRTAPSPQTEALRAAARNAQPPDAKTLLNPS